MYDSSIPAFHSLSNTFILLLNDKTQEVEEDDDAFIKKAFFDTLFAEKSNGVLLSFQLIAEASFHLEK